MEEKKTICDSKSEGNLHPKTVKRAGVLLGIAVLLFSALLVRIFLLQTVKYDYYRQKVLGQITTESSVNASRGNIYDANGIPLAYSIAAISGTLFLIVNLRRRIGSFGFSLGETIVKSVVSAAVMGAAVYGVYYLMRDMSIGGVVVSRALKVLVPTFCGVIVYFVLSVVLRTPPLSAVIGKLKGRGQPSGEEN